jgi:hypothetical protein
MEARLRVPEPVKARPPPVVVDEPELVTAVTGVVPTTVNARVTVRGAPCTSVPVSTTLWEPTAVSAGTVNVPETSPDALAAKAPRVTGVECNSTPTCDPADQPVESTKNVPPGVAVDGVNVPPSLPVVVVVVGAVVVDVVSVVLVTGFVVVVVLVLDVVVGAVVVDVVSVVLVTGFVVVVVLVLDVVVELVLDVVVELVLDVVVELVLDVVVVPDPANVMGWMNQVRLGGPLETPTCTTTSHSCDASQVRLPEKPLVLVQFTVPVPTWIVCVGLVVVPAVRGVAGMR